MTCDWCGHDHSRAALCAKRPTWGRRGFLALMGAGLAGMALPNLGLMDAADFVWAPVTGEITHLTLFALDGTVLAAAAADDLVGITVFDSWTINWDFDGHGHLQGHLER